MATPTTMIARNEFETTDPEVANAALAHMYGDVRSQVFGDPDGFTYRLRSGATERLASARMQFSMGIVVEAELEPAHHNVVAMLGGDHYHAKGPYGEFVLTPSQLAVIPADASVQISLEAVDLMTLSLATDDLSRTAEELYDTPAAGFAVLGTAPTSPQTVRYFRRLVSLASSELLAPDSALEHPLILAETARALCVGFLGAFPTTAAAKASRKGPGDTAPRSLRRAVAFIDANADRPVTLTDIAEAAGTSARAVQHAFRRQYDQTPLGYLRRVRLERAHRELQAADPTRGDTVAAIARRWGFAKPGRFAVTYRETFGVNPGRTLRA